MRYAIVKNNKVVNVIELEEGHNFTLDPSEGELHQEDLAMPGDDFPYTPPAEEELTELENAYLQLSILDKQEQVILQRMTVDMILNIETPQEKINELQALQTAKDPYRAIIANATS